MYIRFLFILITISVAGCTTMHSFSYWGDEHIAKNLSKTDALEYLQNANLAEDNACIFSSSGVSDNSGNDISYSSIEGKKRTDNEYTFITFDEVTGVEDGKSGTLDFMGMTVGLFKMFADSEWYISAPLVISGMVVTVPIDLGGQLLGITFWSTYTLFDLLVPDDSCLVKIPESEEKRFFTALKSMRQQ